MNWEAITSISTLLLAIFTFVLVGATIWLAVIGIQAKNSWKVELRARKKYDLALRLSKFCEDLKGYIEYGSIMNSFSYSYYKKLLNEIKSIEDEYSHFIHKDAESLLLKLIKVYEIDKKFMKEFDFVLKYGRPSDIPDDAGDSEIESLLSKPKTKKDVLNIIKDIELFISKEKTEYYSR